MYSISIKPYLKLDEIHFVFMFQMYCSLNFSVIVSYFQFKLFGKICAEDCTLFCL